MKTVSMKKTIRNGIAYLSAMLMFLAATGTSRAADKPSTAKRPVYYSVLVSKTQNSKKHKIRLFSNAGEAKVLCSVNGVGGKKYEIYIFNVDSKLITQTTLRSGETAMLNNISIGNYFFEVLINDEHVESGKLSIQ
jgi:hypothetical protein